MEKHIVLSALLIHGTGQKREVTTMDGRTFTITIHDFLHHIIETIPSQMRPAMDEVLETLLVFGNHSDIESSLLNIASDFVSRFCESRDLLYLN